MSPSSSRRTQQFDSAGRRLQPCEQECAAMSEFSCAGQSHLRVLIAPVPWLRCWELSATILTAYATPLKSLRAVNANVLPVSAQCSCQTLVAKLQFVHFFYSPPPEYNYDDAETPHSDKKCSSPPMSTCVNRYVIRLYHGNDCNDADEYCFSVLLLCVTAVTTGLVPAAR